MTAGAPRTVGAVTLTLPQAHQLWNGTLSRQCLHPDRRLSSVAEIAYADRYWLLVSLERNLITREQR